MRAERRPQAAARPPAVTSSETGARPWRRFFLALVLTAAGIGGCVAAALLVLDPYDTGRFALFGEYGVASFGQRYTAASLAREPGIDAAIIGNSTIQLVDPARLGSGAAISSVSLAIPGTGPLEQMAVADWLLRHHRGDALRGLVIDIDDSWCRGDGKLALANPFPFWLYAPSALTYAANMVQLQSVEAAARKVKLLLNRTQAARRDGYADYESGRVWDAAAAERRLARPEGAAPAAGGAPARDNFAAAPLLAELLARLPAQTAVVLVMPPHHRSLRPPPGSAAAAEAEACKDRFAAVAARRPRTRLLDFRQRPDLTERDEDYWDPLHYRAPVARAMEAEIAAALR